MARGPSNQPHQTRHRFPAPAMTDCRKIILVDMDAFFASVEQLDHPNLRGLPLVVGGDPRSRGVVAACSYAARAFGIHSAMPCSQARRLCPQAVFVRPRLQRYRDVSGRVMAIFRSCTDLVEPLSLDEAYLDVSSNTLGETSATRIAEYIRARVLRETGLTASAGVSCNKFLAKIASGVNKPDGLTVIPPAAAAAYVAALPVRAFFGVGGATERRMRAQGIRTGADLLRFSVEELTRLFGRQGRFFHDIARGIDRRPVVPHRQRKSLGTETTLARDIQAPDALQAVLRRLAVDLGRDLSARAIRGRTLTLKVRYGDFTTITRSCTEPHGFADSGDLLAQLPRLLAATEAGRRPVRLLGLSVSNLMAQDAPRHALQLRLPFPDQAGYPYIRL